MRSGVNSSSSRRHNSIIDWIKLASDRWFVWAFKFSCSCSRPVNCQLWKLSDWLATKARYEYKVSSFRNEKLTRNADIERANEAHWVSKSAGEINSVLKRKRKEATNTETAKSVAEVKAKWGSSMWKVKVKLIEREKRSSLLGFHFPVPRSRFFCAIRALESAKGIRKPQPKKGEQKAPTHNIKNIQLCTFAQRTSPT